MINPALSQKIEGIQERHEEIQQLISNPKLVAQQDTFQKLMKELSQITPIIETYQTYQEHQTEQHELQVMSQEESETELLAMIQDELKVVKKKIAESENNITLLLLPSDPNDDKNVFLEIRAGTGGEEAAIFVGDLMRMYLRYCEKQAWKTTIISTQPSDQNGYKSVVINIHGNQVYSKLKFESGAHRVQRIPQTESQGRIHTSACTVAILPELEQVESIDLNPKDLRVDTFKASGAGGQHVNKTDSAVRITYLPKNISVECQEERSQHKNKAKAMALLASKLVDQEQQIIKNSHDQTRKEMVGSGDRSEKIRTYNFPQARITDHRIKLTIHQLNGVLGGDLDAIIIPLMKEEQINKLASLKNII